MDWRLKPGSLTTKRYSFGRVSMAAHVLSGGGSWLRKGSCGAGPRGSEGGGGVKIVGGSGGGMAKEPSEEGSSGSKGIEDER